MLLCPSIVVSRIHRKVMGCRKNIFEFLLFKQAQEALFLKVRRRRKSNGKAASLFDKNEFPPTHLV